MKKQSPLILFLSFLLAIILGLGLGCAKKPDDAKISSEIQDKFGQDSGLSSKQLSVKADSGVVTLSGTVDNDTQREAAGKQAASITGVKTVINNLDVSNVGKPSAVAESTPPADMPAASTPADNTPPPSVNKPAKTKSGKSKHSSGASRADDSARQSDSGDSGPQQTANNNMMPPPASNPVQPPPPPPPPKKFTIDQGTQLTVRLVDPIDSEKNQTGDTFHATLNTPLTSDGEQAVPAGVEVVGHLVEVKSAGKFAREEYCDEGRRGRGDRGHHWSAGRRR